VTTENSRSEILAAAETRAFRLELDAKVERMRADRAELVAAWENTMATALLVARAPAYEQARAAVAAAYRLA